MGFAIQDGLVEQDWAPRVVAEPAVTSDRAERPESPR